MRVIYTSENIKIDGIEVRGIHLLPPKTQTWIASQRKLLKASATLPENITANMLARFDDKPVRQAFFLIRKRCYFLDFFFPMRMIAVEIDGSVHRFKKEHDRRRDADFRSIGIRTIRIGNKDVMSGKLYEKLFKGLYK